MINWRRVLARPPLIAQPQPSGTGPAVQKINTDFYGREGKKQVRAHEKKVTSTENVEDRIFLLLHQGKRMHRVSVLVTASDI